MVPVSLTPTSHVILGMLGMRPMSGYEIKQLVDNSTRFFWAASYGQIYPELKRLRGEGLIAGSEEPTGRRRRTVFRLTTAGRRRLREWLAEPPAVFEMRDESLLKLFFAAGDGGASAERAMATGRAHHQGIVNRLRELEPGVAADEKPYQHTVLRFGLALHGFAAELCERALDELGEARASTAGAGSDRQTAAAASATAGEQDTAHA